MPYRKKAIEIGISMWIFVFPFFGRNRKKQWRENIKSAGLS
jgi:hypothetical protein